MSDTIIKDLIEFLKNANLSTYEINAFILLLQSSHSNNLTAKEISLKSKVPSGRIYEILEELREKGMIEIIESRPKAYKSLSLNKALYNLITIQSDENRRRTSFLYDQAKIIESELYNSDKFVKKSLSKIFWSTAFGTQPIISLYNNFCNEAKEELLFNDFFNRNTLKILHYSKNFYKPIKNAVDRGINVKIIWSFEHDERPLSDEQKNRNVKMFKEVIKKHEELFDLSIEMQGFEMKYVHKKIPIYYDIIDRKRVLIKLHSPLKPSQIFACLNVLEPNLGEKLRKKFLSFWLLEAIEL